MNRTLMRIVLPMAALAAMVASSGQALASPLFNLTNPDPYRNSSWIFGNNFTVGAQDLSVLGLGAFDANGNGFVSGSIPVGLYDSSGTLLASASVTSGDPLSNNYRYASIAPITLLSGHQYQVVAVNLDDRYDISTDFTVNPLVTYDGYNYSNGTVLSFQVGGFSGSERVWMANLDVTTGDVRVPEPASVISAAFAGVAGIIFAWRRRSAKPAA